MKIFLHLAFTLAAGSALPAACGSEPWAQQKAVARATGQAADTATRGLTPRLLATFPASPSTPGGPALTPDGRALRSFPNLADNTYPARLVGLPGSGYRNYLTRLPAAPGARHPAPMDLAFGPDGNPYYAENQCENDKDYKSRLMRVFTPGGRPGRGRPPHPGPQRRYQRRRRPARPAYGSAAPGQAAHRDRRR